MKNDNKISKPKIDERATQPYMGIRIQTPMKGMFANVAKLFKELNRWVDARGLARTGVPFHRFHVIDMTGMMDVSVGIPVAHVSAGDGRVQPDVLPAGRYASLVYSGSSFQGNKALVEWARDNGVRWDRWDDPAGDGFRCRYESYLTDPKIEPRKTRWQIEVAIKLADE